MDIPLIRALLVVVLQSQTSVHGLALTASPTPTTKPDPPSVFSLILNANNKTATGPARSSDGVELFQGDIVMTDEIRNELRSMGLSPFAGKPAGNTKRANKRPKRAAMADRTKRWMSNGRPVIPYTFESSVRHTQRLIESSIRHWMKHVPCLRFVRRTSQRSYISFYAGGGCFSHVGRSGGRQRVSIGRGCEHLGVIVHEIGHALGFWHEQSRPDRDRYVKIYWNNILPQFRYAFHKYSTGRINSLGVPYDYNSVMHYDSRAFGQGRTTITRIDGSTNLGNRRGLSASDIKQARLLYCGSTGPKPTVQTAAPTSSVCRYKDLDKYCDYFGKQGYCNSSSRWYPYVSENCKKTCLCGKTSGNCTDSERHCRAWALKGYCTGRYGDYMKKNCKKSCRICS